MNAVTNKTPLWTILAPIVSLGTEFALYGRSGLVPTVLLFFALISTVLAAVHHAEVVAQRIGEPFGAILLALSVTIIELGLIVSIMLGDRGEPTLMRDTIHATIVLVLHGIAGLCIVVGAIRHREQEFRTQGAQSYIIVLLPMVAITLILPNFTTSSPGPFYSNSQLGFVSVVCLVLWSAFTFVQTIRHREYFLPSTDRSSQLPTRPSGKRTLISFSFLIIALVSVVLLAKGVSPGVQSLVVWLNAPSALVGVIVAAIVLLPEGVTAVRASIDNQLQTSINLALGSGVTSIGLTIPGVSLVAWWTSQPLALGVTPGGAVLLTLSFMMALITYGTGRASLLSGIVHLVLLATWVFLVVAP